MNLRSFFFSLLLLRSASIIFHVRGIYEVVNSFVVVVVVIPSGNVVYRYTRSCRQLTFMSCKEIRLGSLAQVWVQFLLVVIGVGVGVDWIHFLFRFVFIKSKQFLSVKMRTWSHQINICYRYISLANILHVQTRIAIRSVWILTLSQLCVPVLFFHNVYWICLSNCFVTCFALNILRNSTVFNSCVFNQPVTSYWVRNHCSKWHADLSTCL